jgi:TPR repeat protein
MTKQSRPSVPRTPMTPADASRIPSTTARKHEGGVPANSSPRRAARSSELETAARAGLAAAMSSLGRILWHGTGVLANLTAPENS